MNVFKTSAVLALSLFISACSSTFKYEKEAQSYKGKPLALSGVEVELDLVSAKQPEGYMDAEAMRTFLAEQIQTELAKSKKVSLVSDTDNAFKAKVKLTYQRSFTYGNAIGKPIISGKVEIISGDQRIAWYEIKNTTINHGGLKSYLVDAKIAAGQWDHENEPEDVQVLAQSIAADFNDF